MATLMKHVGKFGEKPCVVVFRELPGESDYCLIVQTDNLDSRQHDDLMNVVQSAEAQTSHDISQVLHRRQFTDGSNMLSTLHYARKLQKVPVSHVALTPVPGQSVPLADVNVEIRKLEGGYVPPKNDEAHLTESKTPAAVTEEGSSSTETDVAKGLLLQAQLMEEDATKLLQEAESKKAEAYKLDPSLRGPGRPKKAKPN